MIIFATDPFGQPLAGAAPAFVAYRNVESGADLLGSPPTIAERSPGQYEFTPPATFQWAATIDFGAAAGDGRYHVLVADGPFVVVAAFKLTDGTPLTGLAPTWSGGAPFNVSAGRAATGFEIPTPGELGDGLYKILPYPGIHITGFLDLGATAKQRLVEIDVTSLLGFGVALAPLPASSAVVGGGGDLRAVLVGGEIDLAIAADDVATDAGLRTAVILSLMTDRRANDDDEIPSGDGDRRGWWADAFAEVGGDLTGSRMWLLDRAKRTPDVALRVEEIVREALAWMLLDHVAKSIDVEVETTTDQLHYQVTIHRPTGDPVSFRFAHAWDVETEG